MSGFLKSLAHNPRISLGPSDLKPLAEVLSTEKRLVEATHRVSTERTKSSIALKEWGASEGPDLNDVLTKLSMLFDYLSTAEKAYAEHDANYRLHFKNIRTREENLAALKRSKDSLQGKIESADKKVAKMKEENKDLPSALQRLAEMRQEMIGMENSVLNEETSLGDFKRTTTREAMSLKLGALLELAEKTVVVGELGKLMVDEIPTERTEPGAPRAAYNNYEKTDELMQQAQKCISDVVFNPVAINDQYAGAAANAGYDNQQSQQQQYGNGQYDQSEEARQTEFGAGGGQHDGMSYGGAGGGAYQDDSWRQHDAYGQDAYHGAPTQQHGDGQNSYQPSRSYLPEIATASSMTGTLPAGARQGEGDSIVDAYGRGEGSPAPGLGVPQQEHDVNRSSLAYMDDAPSPNAAWGEAAAPHPHHQQQQQQQDEEDLVLAREMAQAEEQLSREKAEAEELERNELARRAREKEEAGRAPYRYSSSGGGGGVGAGSSAGAYEQYQSRDDAPREDAGLPYSPPPPTHERYYPEAVERPYVPREDDGAYHGPTNEPPPSQASAQQQQQQQHQTTHDFAPISTARTPSPPVAAMNTSLPLSPGGPRSPSPPTPTQAQPQVQQQRKPIIIRGESALGSKHGDVFVPNRAAIDGGALNSTSLGGPTTPLGGAGANGSTTPSYVGLGGSAGASGYFRGNAGGGGGGDDRSTNSAEPRKVNAGAFRRAQPVGVGLGAGGPQFGNTMAGPSQADAIRDQYRSAGEGELGSSGTGAAPRFDVSPLTVNKSRNPPLVQPRAGSLPPQADAPPSYQSPNVQHEQPPQSPSAGFAQQSYVTRLD